MAERCDRCSVAVNQFSVNGAEHGLLLLCCDTFSYLFQFETPAEDVLCSCYSEKRSNNKENQADKADKQVKQHKQIIRKSQENKVWQKRLSLSR